MSEDTYLTYNIGDKFWLVKHTHNWLSEKIRMTDADGITWYRYPDGKNTYEIVEIEIVGKMFHSFEGEHSIWCEQEYVDRYCVRVGNSHLDELWQEDLDGERTYKYFLSREEAEAYIVKMKAEE